MRVLVHLRAEETATAGDRRQGGPGRFVSGLLVRGWRTDLPGGRDAIYSFSNLFPPGPALPGDRRNLLVASPDPGLVRALAARLRRDPGRIAAGGSVFRVEGHETFSVRLDRSGLRLVTATPVRLRVPAPGGGGPAYFTPPLGTEAFLAALNRDMVRRYNAHHGARLNRDLRVIADGSLLRTSRRGRVPSSFWELGTGCLPATARRVLEFAVDAGLGEGTRNGFGFVNVVARERGREKGYEQPSQH
ncbi:MAG: CRISPR-associated endoribonuclease Cas6 [Methanospirillum sp.]|nr:CRISPR-associated endoribonuclease Cas6 [Methanospirillum sp.]